MREEELIRQLVALIGSLEVNEGIIKKKFDEEYRRMVKFQKSFLGVQDNGSVEKDFDPRRYAAHILNRGTIEEKRELLGCIKNKLIVKDKHLMLIN